jgi:hypothetical protein
MELCWCCAPCIQERANLNPVTNHSPSLSPVHNNNNADKADSPDSSQAEAIHSLALSPNPIKRHVTFADASAAAANGLYFAGCDLDGLPVPPDVMCSACEHERSHSLSPVPQYKACLDQTSDMKHANTPSTGKHRHECRQFAEETDSSHVGPPQALHVPSPDNSQVRVPGHLRLVLPDTGISDNSLLKMFDSGHTRPSECCHVEPPQCCHVGPNLQQLIANMLVPCDVIVNNQSQVCHF